MSLALRGVDPYLQEAIGWIGSVIESWGGIEYIFSGRRTRQDQQDIWQDCFDRNRTLTKSPFPPCPYPVATPGCSQHEYGFAVDAGYSGPPSGLMTTPDWTGYAQVLARDYWGMSTVAGDPYHFAMYPTSQFLPWAKETGQCVTAPRLSLMQSSAQTWQDCLLEAVRANARGERGTTRSCALPCGSVYGIPCT